MGGLPSHAWAAAPKGTAWAQNHDKSRDATTQQLPPGAPTFWPDGNLQQIQLHPLAACAQNRLGIQLDALPELVSGQRRHQPQD